MTKSCQSPCTARIHTLGRTLECINYLGLLERRFPFAATAETDYHRQRKAMNSKLQLTRFSILQAFRRSLFVGLLVLSMFALVASGAAEAQEGRKVKTKVDPEYPELARRLSIKGVVRVEVTIAAAGTVKNVRELGGNPVLLDALVRAVKKWKYEPADKDSIVEVKFDFTGTS